MSSTTANQLIALGALFVAVVGIVVGFLEGERARRRARDDRRFDQEWSVCIGLIETTLKCQAALNTIIRTEGRERDMPLAGDDYLQHVAAAQLVSKPVADAFRAFATSWNDLLVAVLSTKSPGDVLAVTRTFEPDINAGIEKLVDEAKRLLLSRR